MSVSMLRRTGALLAVALGLVVLASSGAAAVRGPVAHAAGACSLEGKYESLGPTYVEHLAVSGVSCSTGINLIKAYNHCRLQSGGAKGYCKKAVLGFRCTEKRSSSPVQFVASTHCTKPRAVVTFSYSEND